MRETSVILLYLLAGSSVFACGWDRDTLRFEAEGLPDTVQAIVGRFERNPALYYEMRLERVARGLEVDPTRLALYDDAGVACDRLGRGDDAIEWMERKRVRLAELEADSPLYRDHQYRYLANAGTFYAHRWFRNGADFERLDDLESAIVFIKAAIELNPDAHFGREKYQLMALEWILSKPEMPQGDSPAYGLPGFLDYGVKERRRFNREDRDEAIRGITGLIMLGNAWSSFDMFYALGQELQGKGDSLLALMAWQRCLELAGNGAGSIVLGAPQDYVAYYEGHEWIEAAEHAFSTMHQFNTELNQWVDPRAYQAIGEEYVRQRENAEAWHRHRTEFMLTRLGAGQHPDTHDDFWALYEAVPGLEIQAENPYATRHKRRQRAIFLCVASLLVVGTALVLRRRYKKAQVIPE